MKSRFWKVFPTLALACVGLSAFGFATYTIVKNFNKTNDKIIDFHQDPIVTKNALALKALNSLTNQETQELIRYKVNLKTTDLTTTKYNLTNSYVNSLYQYNLEKLFQAELSEKQKYLKTHANSDVEVTHLNETAKTLNTWNNLLNTNTNEQKYAFSSDISQSYDSLTCGVGLVGNGNILFIHQRIARDEVIGYKVYVLTNHHVAQIVTKKTKENLFVFSNNNNKIILEGSYKLIKNTKMQNNDLALLEFNVDNKENIENNSTIFEPYFNKKIAINTVNYEINLKNAKNTYYSSKFLEKKRDKYNQSYYQGVSESVFINPFINSEYPHLLNASIKNSIAGVSGSGVYLLTKNEYNEIVPVLVGVLSGGYVNEIDEKRLLSGQYDNLGFNTLIDDTNLGISFIRIDFSGLKEAINEVEQYYYEYLNAIK